MLHMLSRMDIARVAVIGVALLLVSFASAGAQQSNPRLSVAAKFGDIDEVRRLLAAGALVDERGVEGTTALMSAASYGRLEIVGLLLANGANPHLMDDRDRTPVIRALAHDHSDVVARLRRAMIAAPPRPGQHGPAVTSELDFRAFDRTQGGYLSGTEIRECECASYDVDRNGRVTEREFRAGRAAAKSRRSN